MKLPKLLLVSFATFAVSSFSARAAGSLMPADEMQMTIQSRLHNVPAAMPRAFSLRSVTAIRSPRGARHPGDEAGRDTLFTAVMCGILVAGACFGRCRPTSGE